MMIGDWVGAFGIQRLTISNVMGEIGVTIRPPWLAVLALGGTIRIGDVNDPSPIVGKLYFRIDTTDPTQNYFFGSVEQLTFGNIFTKILGVNVNLPSFLASTGFNFAMISYAQIDVAATAYMDFIPAGFRFSGQVNLFGKTASCTVVVSPSKFRFEFEFFSLSWGILNLYRSSRYKFHIIVFSF